MGHDSEEDQLQEVWGLWSGMETSSERTHGKSRRRRHTSTGLTYRMKPLAVRKGGQILIGNCSTGASKGANTVTMGAMEMGVRNPSSWRGFPWGEGRKEDVLRGPTVLEKIWKLGC